MKSREEQTTDFIILGSGIAGVRAAIDLARHGHVLVLSKGPLYESNTEYAQGGIAVAIGEDDEVSLHLHDTLQAGDGLCREEAVKVLVEEGPERIRELIEGGMHFDSNGHKLSFTREAAHSRSRVLHAHGDSTGSEMLRALVAKAKGRRDIKLNPFAFAVDFLADWNRVTGVRYLDEKSGVLKEVSAGSVLLATGGLGQIYRETTNPPMACGDGVAMAYRAGAVVSDMEFIQFHPTALYVKGAPRFLLSEALRGEGGQLRNIDLERFMPRYHEAAELAPRDVVSRALVMEMRRTGSEFNYLDLTGLDPEHVKQRFPKIYSTCLAYNIDISADLIPVRPAAHYSMGGVATDLDGASSLEGLYAAGEVASTGVHGANRLASNSLLEGLVFGARAAAAMSQGRSNRTPAGGRAVEPDGAPAARKTASREATGQGSTPKAAVDNSADNKFAARAYNKAEIDKLTQEVRRLMWEKVGIIRTGKELREVTARLDALCVVPAEAPDRACYEAQNILEVARLIARSALARQESRGAHYRSDFPLKNAATRPQHSYVSKNSTVHFK